MIARGMFHLAQSAAGDEITAYHLQAGIAACHCAAKDYASTDWRQILSLYDRLVELDDSPVVALNRAVALAEVRGPRRELKPSTQFRICRSLESYYLLHAVLGEFESRLEPRAGRRRPFPQITATGGNQIRAARSWQNGSRPARITPEPNAGKATPS